MSKQKEVAVKESAAVMTADASANLDAWGDNQLSSKDMVIPKILCMQGLSDLVADGKAKMGDFVDSLTSEVLGDIDNPVSFIPFHMEKIYIIGKRNVGESRFEFDRIEDVANQNYPFNSVEGTVETKYEYCLQFYVLRPEDPSLPYVISFKSTSLKAGKALATQMFIRNRSAGLVPPAYTMLLGGKKEKNDKGTFAVMEVKQSVKTEQEQINGCLEWMQLIKAGKATVSHSDVTNNGQAQGAATNF